MKTVQAVGETLASILHTTLVVHRDTERLVDWVLLLEDDRAVWNRPNASGAEPLDDLRRVIDADGRRMHAEELALADLSDVGSRHAPVQIVVPIELGFVDPATDERLQPFIERVLHL